MDELLWPSFLPQTPWLQLAAASAAVVLAGIKLSRYGDLLAGRLGLGHAVVGVIFLAFATSLPEIATCIGSVAWRREVGLAVGNGFGSIAFNLAIIFVADLMAGRGSIFLRLSKHCVRPALLSLVMIAIFGASLGVEALSPVPLNVLGVGPGSFVIVAAYALGVWWLSRKSRGEIASIAQEEGEEEDEKRISTIGIFARYLVVALVILWAGLNLAAAGDRISDQYGLGTTFVGVIFLAIATSLPELTVAITSARRGLYEMVIGNIFGANMFNVLVIACADAFYRDDSIARVTMRSDQAVQGTIAVSFAAGLTCVAILGVMKRASLSLWRVTIPSAIIFALYLGMTYWLYVLR
jgi:cation:H+ antiporter